MQWNAVVAVCFSHFDKRVYQLTPGGIAEDVNY
jgi:hypothetical protein